MSVCRGCEGGAAEDVDDVESNASAAALGMVETKRRAPRSMSPAGVSFPKLPKMMMKSVSDAVACCAEVLAVSAAFRSSSWIFFVMAPIEVRNSGGSGRSSSGFFMMAVNLLFVASS